MSGEKKIRGEERREEKRREKDNRREHKKKRGAKKIKEEIGEKNIRRGSHDTRSSLPLTRNIY